MELHFSVTGSPYSWANTTDSDIPAKTGQEARETMAIFLYAAFVK